MIQPQLKENTNLKILKLNENCIEFECETTEPAIILITDNYEIKTLYNKLFKKEVLERFLRYAVVDTMSDETKAEIKDGDSGTIDTSSKSSLQNTIDQAKKNAAAAQSALAEENKKISSLSKEETLTAEAEEADNRLPEIIEELTSLQMQLEEITEEIEQTKRDLAAAEDEAERQYQMMKLRIAYMYEQSEVDQFAALLNKGSFKDILNALQYMNSVYDYDRNLLDEYEATVQEITCLKIDLENEKMELEEVEAAYEAQEKELEIAIAELQTKIANVDAAINNAAKKAKAYEATIAAENAKIGGWGEGFDPFYGAPVILIVLADKNIATYKYDGSLVMGNLMNAAESLGVNSIWIHRAKEEFESDFGKKILEKLGISGDYEGIGHCALGYASKEPNEAAPRKDGYVYYIK